MHGDYITTPFGRRPMTLDHMKVQIASAAIEPGTSVDKWNIFRNACEARSVLGLRDRALAVLSALISFHPDTELSEGKNLIVFPSNAQLSARANGIAGTTLRENLSHLIKAGLISRVDSPNGKRYAHRTRGGAIEAAYGFSLAPLLRRADELLQLSNQIAEDRRYLKLVKERITIVRRDVRKLLATAIIEHPDHAWSDLQFQYAEIVSSLQAAKSLPDQEAKLESLTVVHRRIVNLLQENIIFQNSVANDIEIRCHIQDSETDSYIDFEAGTEDETKENLTSTDTPRDVRGSSYPLSIILKACPQIADYGPRGQISSWEELIRAAAVVSSMLDISPSARHRACAVMGPQNTAAAISYILERGERINSAGGYLRGLTERAARKQFAIGPMLSSLRTAASAPAAMTPIQSQAASRSVGSSQRTILIAPTVSPF